MNAGISITWDRIQGIANKEGKRSSIFSNNLLKIILSAVFC
jgi:hypothetical protein